MSSPKPTEGSNTRPASDMEPESPPSKKARLEDAASTTSLALPEPSFSGTLDLSDVIKDDFDDIYNSTPPQTHKSLPRAPEPTENEDDVYDTDFDLYSPDPEPKSKHVESEPVESKPVESKPGVGLSETEEEPFEPLPRLGLPGLPGLPMITGLGSISQSGLNGLNGVNVAAASETNGQSSNGLNEERSMRDQISYAYANEDSLAENDMNLGEGTTRFSIPGLPSLTNGKESIIPGLGQPMDASEGTWPGFGRTTGSIESTLPGLGGTMSTNVGFTAGFSHPTGVDDSVLPSIEDEWAEDSNPDVSSSASGLDDDGDDYPLLSAEEQARVLMRGEPGADDDAEGGGSGGAENAKTKNEIEERVEKPQVAVTAEMKIEELGRITSIVGPLVVVQAKVSGEHRVLESGSVLCLADRTVIGVVSETLGQVQQPYYTVRFNSLEEIAGLHLTVTTPVYYVEQHSTYVFTHALKAVKGSDASNLHDEEVGDDEVEFSDDEAEMAHKRRIKEQRQGRRGGSRGGRSRQTSTRQSTLPQMSLPGLNYDEPTVETEPMIKTEAANDDGEPYRPLTRPSNFQALVGGGSTIEESPSRGHFSRGFRGGRKNDGGGGRGFRGRGGRGFQDRGGRGGFGRGRRGQQDHRRNNRDALERRRSDPHGTGVSHRNFSPPSTGDRARYSPAVPQQQSARAASTSYPTLSDEYNPAIPNAAAASALLAHFTAQSSPPAAMPNLGQYQQQYEQQPYTPQPAPFSQQQYYTPQPAPVPPPFYAAPPASTSQGYYMPQPVTTSQPYSASSYYGTMPPPVFQASPPVETPFRYPQVSRAPTTPQSAPAGGFPPGGPLPAGAFVNPAFFRNPQSTPMRTQHSPPATQSAFSPGSQPTMTPDEAFRLAQEKLDILKRLYEPGSGPS